MDGERRLAPAPAEDEFLSTIETNLIDERYCTVPYDIIGPPGLHRHDGLSIKSSCTHLLLHRLIATIVEQKVSPTATLIEELEICDSAHAGSDHTGVYTSDTKHDERVLIVR